MNGNIEINENLILPRMDAKDSKQVLYELSKRMEKYGYVKDTFYEAVLKREGDFPTGLKCGQYNFAIPHTESIHVNRSCIGIATLQQGVDFRRMDEPEDSVNVFLVVLLASAGGHEHIEILRRVIKIFQSEASIQQLVNTENKREIVQILKQCLLGGSDNE